MLSFNYTIIKEIEGRPIHWGVLRDINTNTVIDFTTNDYDILKKVITTFEDTEGIKTVYVMNDLNKFLDCFQWGAKDKSNYRTTNNCSDCKAIGKVVSNYKDVLTLLKYSPMTVAVYNQSINELDMDYNKYVTTLVDKYFDLSIFDKASEIVSIVDNQYDSFIESVKNEGVEKAIEVSSEIVFYRDVAFFFKSLMDSSVSYASLISIKSLKINLGETKYTIDKLYSTIKEHSTDLLTLLFQHVTDDYDGNYIYSELGFVIDSFIQKYDLNKTLDSLNG